MATHNPSVLTPMRSPMRSSFRSIGGGGATRLKAGGGVAVGSLEKETPTVVFTENSPYSNIKGGNGATIAMRKMSERKLLYSSSSFDASSPYGEGDYSPRASRYDDNDEDDESDDEELSYGSDEIIKQEHIVTMVQNVLDGGIASICRLRGLFPSTFYNRMAIHDDDGTTVTKFNVEKLKRICGMSKNDDDGDDDDDNCQSDDDDTMVKCFTIKSLLSQSPLTMTMGSNGNNRICQDRPPYSDEEKRMAAEALLLVSWMQRGGVNKLLHDGNLSRLVFGICVPLEKPPGDNVQEHELVESYSFDISYKKPNPDGEIKNEEVLQTVGSVFQNLNGFRAGRSKLCPSKTQNSHCLSVMSQCSRATSYGGGSQMSSVDFSSNKIESGNVRSQMLMSQKSLMQGMSQSIQASVKQNRGRIIPKNRFLSLRVEFSKSLSNNELPPALKQSDARPISIIGETRIKPQFVVTPLGRISESGYSGLCIDMEARVDVEEKDDDDHIRFSTTEHSQLLTQPVDSGADIECEHTVADMDLQVGRKALGMPYGLQGGSKYLLCVVNDQRITERYGSEVTEFKCEFSHSQLKTIGKKKQWLPHRKLISYARMTENVRDMLVQTSSVSDVAKELNVDIDFVRDIAKKRKSNVLVPVGNLRTKKSKP